MLMSVPSLASRRALLCYRLPACSINFCNIFPERNLLRWLTSIRPSATPKASPAGHSSWRWNSVNWPTRIRCARSATAWLAVKANWCISASPTHQQIHPVLCQRAPPGGALRRPVLHLAEPLPRTAGHGRPQGQVPLQNKLLSLDSTTISLCLDLFPWAKFRRAKGGVKAHVLLDHDDYLPSYVLITEAKKSDVRMAQSLDLNAGSIVAMDRGYNDYALFGKWTDGEVFFVTRLKDNAAYEVVESAMGPLPRNILADELIRFTGAQAVKDCPHLMRRVVVWDPINEREIVLFTNLLPFAPTTVLPIYKDRWEIELFFKALKQNLKVKSFVGTSRNALLIQIWTALIAMLLLKWLHHLSQAKWSFSNLASMLRLNLFTYRDLRRWLENPFGTPPLVPLAEQLSLELS